MIKIVDNGGNLPTLIMDEQNVVIRFFCSIIERGCLLYDHRYSEQRQEGAYMRSLSQPITRSIAYYFSDLRQSVWSMRRCLNVSTKLLAYEPNRKIAG